MARLDEASRKESKVWPADEDAFREAARRRNSGGFAITLAFTPDNAKALNLPGASEIYLWKSVFMNTSKERKLLMSIQPSLVNGTSWRVAGFEGGKLGTFHKVPWVFKSDSSVSAANLWNGVWVDIGDGYKVKCILVLGSGQQDAFDVIFTSPGWFVATKNNDLYRLGKRI